MKASFPILLLGLAFAIVNAAEETDSIVRFSNGDRMVGSLESLSPDLLVWKSPVLEKSVPFFLKNIIDLSLPVSQPENHADHQAILTLTNGDSIRGQLAAVTDQTVSLDTWYAGRMDFNRLMISGVKIEGRTAMAYRGPVSLEGWKQSDRAPAWKYRNFAFVSHAQGSIARDGLLTEESSVSFDAAWKGDSFELQVVLFSDDASSSTPSSGYELSFKRGGVYLRNCKAGSYIGSAQSQALLENEKVHVEIRASWKTGKVCLFINDRIIEVWSDPEAAKGKFGSGLHFIAPNTLPLRVSGIAVAPWNGVVDKLPEPRLGLNRQFGLQGMREEPKPAPPEKPKEGRMELANGDSLEGEVTGIHDGVISLKAPLGEIKLPVARLRSIALKKAELERCIRRNGDIRAWFPDGSAVVFRLDAVGDGTLTGSSQNFGTATFKLSAFSRIEFNIHEVALEDKRANGDW